MPDEPAARHALVLDVGGQRFVPGQTTADSEQSLAVVFAGDLNADGPLDLVLRESRSNSGSVCLVLSRMAPAPAFVRIGCQHTTGC